MVLDRGPVRDACTRGTRGPTGSESRLHPNSSVSGASSNATRVTAVMTTSPARSPKSEDVMTAVTRVALLLAPLALLLACNRDSDPVGPRVPRVHASRTGPRSKTIPGQYIVVLRSGVPDVRGLAERLATQHGAGLLHVYTAALRGFSL